MSKEELQQEVEALRVVLKERCAEIDRLKEYISKLEASVNRIIIDRERFSSQSEW